MSIMNYIASNKKLPLGEFPNKQLQYRDKSVNAIRFESVEITEDHIPLEQIIELPKFSENETQVFNSYEDAAGIYISNFELGGVNLKKQFKSRFVYRLSANFGNFYITRDLKNSHPQIFEQNKKCIHELIKFISQNIDENEEIEIYTCWFGEENSERNHKLDKVINLEQFNVDDFGLIEGQHISFIKSKEP